MKTIWCDKCGDEIPGTNNIHSILEGGKAFDLCLACYESYMEFGAKLRSEAQIKKINWLETPKPEIEFTPPKDKKAYLHEGVKTNLSSFGFVDHD